MKKLLTKQAKVSLWIILSLVLAQVSSAFVGNSAVAQAHGLEKDESITALVINSPPHPPAGVIRTPVTLPKTNRPTAIVTLPVPAYSWVFGCSAVSAAMIAGYFDRNGYSLMYLGPANGSVAPMDDTVWSTWSDGSAVYPNNPLVASHNGVDGRTTLGSIDDYWVQYNSSLADPYLTGGWTQHTWGTAVGDYMKTSQSAYGNPDGQTRFYNYTSSASPLTCSAMEANNIDIYDGTYGRKLFYEARGYTVTDCYNQKTDNNGGGFTFDLYKSEIDKGYPVLLNLEGHSIVGVGYDSTTNQVYLHDTWDDNTYTMNWGGSYSGMPLRSVSIVHPDTTTPPGAFAKISPSNGATAVSTSPSLSWASSAGATGYEYCYDISDDNACSNWTSTGTATTANLSSLSNGTTYYWQVRAKNSSGTTYANGSSTAYWSFTTAVNPPGAFSKSDPPNGAAGLSTGPALSWEASSGATGYEYCYDISDDNACSSWTSTGTATTANLNSLSNGTTYYWQVRANNSTGTTYANGSSTAYWSFTTAVNPPGAFSKSDPPNGAAGLSTGPALSWESSAGATGYEYCYDISDDNACSSWTSTGTATTANLNSLSNATTYYWQVRASNADGMTYADNNTWWSFTTQQADNPLPAIASISPAWIAVGGSDFVLCVVGSNFVDGGSVIRWNGSDRATTFYDSSTLCTTITSQDVSQAGTAAITVFNPPPGGGLSNSKDFYIIKDTGTDISANWTTIAPTINGAILPAEWNDAAAYSITAPGYSAMLESVPHQITAAQGKKPSLQPAQPDQALSEVTLYVKNDGTHLYLAFDNPNDTTAESLDQVGIYFDDNPIPSDGQWTNTTCGNLAGEGNYWIIQDTPQFREWISGPSDCPVVDDPPGITGAIDYTSGHIQVEVEIDLTSSALRASPGNAINMYLWIYNAATASMEGQWTLTADYSNPASYKALSLAIAPPSSFSKNNPTNGATGISLNPTLSWEASSGATSYEYCYDTSNDNTCSNWTSTATATTASLSSLSNSTTYYWQVRANNT